MVIIINLHPADISFFMSVHLEICPSMKVFSDVFTGV